MQKRIWNAKLISTLFWPEDRELIVQIPLSFTGMLDLLVWHYSNNGIFSVRSAYHLALSLASPAGTSGDRWSRNTWRKVWQASIPNKAKVFIWRAIRNILPTSGNLQKRLQQVVACCPFCDCVEETPIHTLLRCSFARQVWALSDIHWQNLNFHALSVEHWIDGLSLKLPSSDFNFVIMICWTIWWSRNLKLARKDFLFPLQVVDFARNYLLAFSSHSPKNTLAVSVKKDSWSCPPTGWIKVNFDGNVLDGGRALGLGIIARDAVGSCLAWLSVRLNRGGSAELAEVFAAREAICLAQKYQWHQVILEGDCSSVLDKLFEARPNFSISSPLIADTRSLCSLLNSVSFSHVLRSGNVAADFLASSALNQVGDSSLLPPGLSAVILDDLSH
ncbi:UNVERIFIED_CONTAM: putative ribonuclease H protein [Sesamum latifolium]|uniref:Ribonuclease H protein n=1 Tax=Sesamum latifolium TaxID=2727402 RepID=A0AAW2X7G0_9LAMI